MFDKISWVTNAVIAGGMFGMGVIFMNALSRNNFPVSTTLAAGGLVWLIIGSGFVQTSALAGLDWKKVALIILAGVLFFIGNVAQFKATAKSPLSGYALLTITMVSVFVTILYEVFQKWSKGTLVIMTHQVVAALLALASVAILFICQKK